MKSVRNKILVLNTKARHLIFNKMGSKIFDILYVQIGEKVYLSVSRDWLWSLLLRRIEEIEEIEEKIYDALKKRSVG